MDEYGNEEAQLDSMEKKIHIKSVIHTDREKMVVIFASTKIFGDFIVMVRTFHGKSEGDRPFPSVIEYQIASIKSKWVRTQKFIRQECFCNKPWDGQLEKTLID